MAMTSPRYIRPARDRFIVEQLSDGSVAVFDRTGDAVHSLNPAAAAVWASCTEPASVDDLRDALAGDGTNPLGIEAIEAAVQQLLKAGLLQEVQGVSVAVALATLSSRRQALRQIAGGAAAVAALPVVLTLAGKEQRLLAQGCGSPLVDLTGCWTFEVEGDDDPLLFTLTQSGNTVTGTFFVLGFPISGTVSGTLCGTTLDLTANGTEEGGTCIFTYTFTSTNVTDNAFSGTALTDYAASGCGALSGTHSDAEFTATRGCAPN